MTPTTCDPYVQGAFLRNLGLFSREEQDRLAASCIAVPGMGGVGGSHLVTLARCGVGGFHIADFDTYEPVNANRQYGAKASTMGKPKLEVMAAEALDVNPALRLEKFPDGVAPDNLDAFLSGVDVVVDGLDFFAVDIRRALFNRALELNIPVITAGPMGFSTALLVFMPGGPNFDQHFGYAEDMAEFDKHLHFFVGLTPKAPQSAYTDPASIDLTRRRGPSCIIACQLCAAAAAMEAVRIILGRPGVRGVPHFQQYDLYRRKWIEGRMLSANSPLRRLKRKIAKDMVVFKGFRVQPEVPCLQPGEPILNSESTEFLMDAAIQAPSGDNVQPWKFHAHGDALDIRSNFAADTSFFNVRQVATLIASGAAAENASLAASLMGLAADVAVMPEPDKPDLSARVSFSRAGEVQPDPLADAVWKRMTNRKPFAKDPLGQGVLDGLRHEAERIPGAKLHLLTTREQITEAANLIFRTDPIRAEHRNLHEHFISMVRFTADDVLRTQDGLPIKNLEAGPHGELFLKVTRSWKAMSMANRLGLGKLVADVSRKGMLASGAIGLVTVPAQTEADFVTGGRALQRVWLAANQQGVQFQPMTVITLFKLRWLWEGPQAFSPEHQTLLKDIWPRFDALFPDVTQDNGLVMLFRLGKGPRGKHGTYRRPVEGFVE